MIDFATARRMMVDSQVRTSDVTDPRLIAAMLEIPRERFVPESEAALAYLDFDVPVARASSGGEARRLLKPMVFAKLIQAAEINENQHVLDVGCATGYSSAVLSRLARAVVALEEDAALARHAAENLQGLGASLGGSNVRVVTGPLPQGWPAEAPYDVIFVNGAIEIEPQALARQLRDGGCLVAVKGRAPNGKAMLYRCVNGELSGWPIFDAAAPLLPGFAAPPVFVF
jgi:protein-L-isoaspartate(D-aspartate) O-methyltransferase